MRSELLIIIPAYNEEENIENVVNYIIQKYAQYDYIVVNDGSKDRTAEICKEKGYEFAQEKFSIFVRDKKGKELADIRIYDEINISCVKGYGAGTFNIGYHATNGVLDLEKLSSLSE